jgi:ribosomal-protein-alanine N-acetyltransferase
VIAFAPLSSIDPEYLRALLTDQAVIRHMPLADPEPMSLDELRDWVAGKEAITQQHGFGPQAILLDGYLAGWGGIEPDGVGASISLVLLPAFWGRGRQILDTLLEEVFGRLGLPYVLVEFPPSRTRVRGLLHLGFRKVGDRTIEGERFVVYRLEPPSGERRRSTWHRYGGQRLTNERSREHDKNSTRQSMLFDRVEHRPDRGRADPAALAIRSGVRKRQIVVWLRWVVLPLGDRL